MQVRVLFPPQERKVKMNANLLKLKLDCITQSRELEKTKKLFREEFDKVSLGCKHNLTLFKDHFVALCLSKEHKDYKDSGNYGDCVPMKCPLI